MFYILDTTSRSVGVACHILLLCRVLSSLLLLLVIFFLIPVDIMWRNKVGVLIILISIRIEEVGFGREDRQWCILYVCLLLFHYSVPRPYLAR